MPAKCSRLRTLWLHKGLQLIAVADNSNIPFVQASTTRQGVEGSSLGQVLVSLTYERVICVFPIHLSLRLLCRLLGWMGNIVLIHSGDGVTHRGGWDQPVYGHFKRNKFVVTDTKYSLAVNQKF